MVLKEFIDEWFNDEDRIPVHTSGSTGKPKTMLVEKKRMAASARITCSFLGLDCGDSALLCMPLDYIAGKMMVVRSVVCGLNLISVPPSGHPLKELSAAQCDNISLAAMVPMQVYNTLNVPEEMDKLRRIRNLIIGGGAVDDGMCSVLRTFPNAVWSTYGMTETLSHIALRRLNGNTASDWYMPFEGVSVEVDARSCLVIKAPHVCSDVLVTNDIAEIASDGRHFRISGRIDNTICSGGIKIQIEELERKLKPYITVPFVITKRKDARFGEVMVLLAEGDIPAVRATCRRVLPKYSCPRIYIYVDKIPVTGTGKPARAEAMIMAAEDRSV